MEAGMTPAKAATAFIAGVALIAASDFARPARQAWGADGPALTVTARGSDANAAFGDLRRVGLRVHVLGRARALVVPSGLRFRAVSGVDWVNGVADFHGLKVFQIPEVSAAVLYAGAPDDRVARLKTELGSDDAARRAAAAWEAGWAEDIRVVRLLLDAGCAEKNPHVAFAIRGSLNRLGWPAAVAVAEENAWRCLGDDGAPLVELAGRAGGRTALAILRNALQQEGWRDRQLMLRVISALAATGDPEAATVLEGAAGNGDKEIRCAAIAALGNVGGEKALKRLERFLGHRDADIRREAVGAIGEIGGERARPLLEKAMTDSDKSVRVQATAALGSAGGAMALGYLDKALADASIPLRHAACSALDAIGGERARAPLGKALADGEWPVRRKAAESLGRLGGDPAARILKAAMGDRDTRVRETVFAALAENAGGDACAALSEALDDPDVSIRKLAAGVLWRLGRAEALRFALRAAADKESLVRAAAIASLGRIGGKDADAVIEKALTDTDASVRLETAAALGRRRDGKALEWLDKAMRDLDGDVRLQAVLSLEIACGTGGLGVLEGALGDDQQRVRREAALAAGRIGGERAVAVIDKAIADANKTVRGAAAESAGRIGGEVALGVLEKAAADAEWRVRLCAMQSLGAAYPATERVLATLKRGAADPDARVSLAAAGAMGRMRGNATPVLIEMLTAGNARRLEPAIQGLARCGKAAVPGLLALLRDADAGIRRNALLALKAHPDASDLVLKALQTAMREDGSSVVRSAAAAAIGARGDAGVAILTLGLKDPDLSVQTATLNSLGNMGSDGMRAAPMLLAALPEMPQSLRESALKTLVVIGSEEPLPASLIPDLIRLMEKGDTKIGYKATDQIARMGKPALQAMMALTGNSNAQTAWRAVYALGAMGPEADEAIPLLEKLTRHANPTISRMAKEALAKVGQVHEVK
jgi:HEAT repeat protein